MTEPNRCRGPLDDVRVVDLTTSLGAYTGRLLSDLGAEVIRVEPVTERPERHRPPLSQSGLSLNWAFMEAGKRIVSEADVDVASVIGTANLLLTSEGPAALSARGLHPGDTTQRNPALVHVSVSPYGLTGPYADRPASDLTLLAAGGLLALAGDPDREPVRAWGDQTAVIAGTHAATAALIALLSLESTGRGQVVDLSAQEAVAHSLENAVQYLDLEGSVRRRAGAGPVEAGTGLFRCADGWVYLVGGLGGRPLAWPALVGWLLDMGATEAETLLGPQWQERSWRRSHEASRIFRSIFERAARSGTKQELYEAGQSRGVSIAPVATPADLLASPQLTERGFFVPISVDGEELLFPGPPYRFAGAPVGPRSGEPAVAAGAAPRRSGTPEHERTRA
jgi:benzylsuccinate CoA-transferase BbsE subunit